ncbi:MAG: LD-carboxypeptidase [Candidatus Melainabacteria bacterium]|nr:LD-carboxypeptidase [Candidatus Melainabacteria bacterium]
MTPAPIRPKALQPGSTVAILSPAAPTVTLSEGADPFEMGMAQLQARGYQPKLMPNTRAYRQHLAGADAQRLQDLHDAFADPTIDAILCARGGYGTMRLLSKLSYELVGQHPKILIGFSDITALHLALWQRTGLVGFYGPMLTSNLIDSNATWDWQQLCKLVGTPPSAVTLPIPLENLDPYTCLTPGISKGRLLGGNLSLLAALCGTPFQPDTTGAILFIEDWRERYYSLDRQLMQLKLAGLLDQVAGLLFCDFSEIPTEFDIPLAVFIQQWLAEMDLGHIPAGFGWSVGHGEHTATLPIGVQAQLNTETGQLLLLECPVS